MKSVAPPLTASRLEKLLAPHIEAEARRRGAAFISVGQSGATLQVQQGRSETTEKA